MNVTDEMVLAFKKAWHDADAEGAEGHRVEAGLAAVLALVPEPGIQPGDWVEHRTKDLDPREVLVVGLDWLVLDFGMANEDGSRVPKDNYRIVRRAGVL